MSIGRILVFLLVMGGLGYGLHAFLLARLVRDPALEGGPKTALTVAIWGLFGLLFAGMFLARAPRAIAQPFAWIAFTWMGFAFLLFVALLGGDLLRGLLALAAKAGIGAPIDADRRQFLARAIAAVAGLAAGATGVAGIVAARARVQVKPVQVALKGLADAGQGYRIVQLSDVHIGPTIGHDWLAEVVATVNAEKPDLIVITGDLVDGSVSDLASHVAPLKDLSARDGVYFVTGNHEYYSGADAWLAHLETLNVKPLRNARVALDHFDLAGVDDAMATGEGHGADYERALGGRTADRPLVLLAHQPKQIMHAAKYGIDLQISGHTHGDQIAPFQFLVPLQQPYVAGLYRHDGRAQIYVSRGTGYWGPPMRVGAPAEITRIERVAESRA
jgi:hypothetical protein